jgi:hypothetical protein
MSMKFFFEALVAGASVEEEISLESHRGFDEQFQE